jgi:hypothetical protein
MKSVLDETTPRSPENLLTSSLLWEMSGHWISTFSQPDPKRPVRPQTDPVDGF